MKCQYCRRETKILISHPSAERLYCSDCRDAACVRKPDGKAYTGRKIWHQSQCYTPKELRAANEATAETWTRAAKEHRKKIRPSLLAAMGGA